MAFTSILELGMRMTKDDTASDEAKAERARKIEAIVDETLFFVEKMLLARLDVPVRPLDETTPEYHAYLQGVQAAINKEIYSEKDDVTTAANLMLEKTHDTKTIDDIVIRVTAYNLAIDLFANADKQIDATIGKLLLGSMLARMKKMT